MTRYIATEKNEAGRRIVVEADTIQEAAELAILRLVGRGVCAHRCTGDSGLPGIWQGYRRCQGSGIVNLTSAGPNIHLVSA